VVAGVVLLIAAEPVALVAQLASLSFDGDTAIAVLSSNFGRLLGLRLGVAFFVWALLALESPWPVLGLGAVMALIDGATAHAFPGLPWAGLLVDATHVGAMAIWVGGLAAFLLVPDRRFSRYAGGAIAVSVVSGLVLALAHLGSLGALVTTDYGWTLAIKVPVVGAALALALLGRHRIESWVVTIILALAAVLVSLPPPR
jgi:putative copper export protein